MLLELLTRNRPPTTSRNLKVHLAAKTLLAKFPTSDAWKTAVAEAETALEAARAAKNAKSVEEVKTSELVEDKEMFENAIVAASTAVRKKEEAMAKLEKQIHGIARGVNGKKIRIQ